MRYNSVVTTKGQVTIPAELRRILDLHPGDEVGFVRKEQNILMYKRKNDVSAVFGLYTVNRKVSLDDIEGAIPVG